MRLLPKGHRDRKALSLLIVILTTLGSSEEDILLILQLQTERALKGTWEVHSVTTQTHKSPCTLRDIWVTATKKKLRGDLLLIGPTPPTHPDTADNLATLTDIGGHTILHEEGDITTAQMTPRKPQVLPTEITLRLGPMTKQHLTEWLQISDENETTLGALLTTDIESTPD